MPYFPTYKSHIYIFLFSLIRLVQRCILYKFFLSFAITSMNFYCTCLLWRLSLSFLRCFVCLSKNILTGSCLRIYHDHNIHKQAYQCSFLSPTVHICLRLFSENGRLKVVGIVDQKMRHMAVWSFPRLYFCVKQSLHAFGL